MLSHRPFKMNSYSGKKQRWENTHIPQPLFNDDGICVVLMKFCPFQSGKHIHSNNLLSLDDVWLQQCVTVDDFSQIIPTKKNSINSSG